MFGKLLVICPQGLQPRYLWMLVASRRVAIAGVLSLLIFKFSFGVCFARNDNCLTRRDITCLLRVSTKILQTPGLKF